MVVHRGQQLDCGRRDGARAAHGLAVHRYRPSYAPQAWLRLGSGL
ncbi:hypothetical protein [Streptomyces sp900116325]